MEEPEKKGQHAPPSSADDWSNTQGHPKLSAGWPLLWIAVLLIGIVLWGYFTRS